MPVVSSGRIVSGTGAVTFTGNTTGVATSGGSQASTTSTTSSSSSSTLSSGGLLSVSGLNIGDGIGIYAGETGTQITVLDFKTLVNGTGITITENASTITLTADNGGAGGVTSITIAGANGIGVSNPTVTTTGTITVELNDTGVTPGTYSLSTVTVDATGRILAASSGTSGGGAGTVTSITIAGANGIGVANPTVTTTGTVTVELNDTGVTPGTYSLSTVTVDATGRILAASSGAGSAGAQPYIISGFFVNTLNSGDQIVLLHQVALPVTYPTNLGVTVSGGISSAGALNAASNTMQFFFQHCLSTSDATNNANWSNVAVFTFAPESANATIVSNSIVFSQLDYARVISNTNIDLTLGNVFFTLVGDR